MCAKAIAPSTIQQSQLNVIKLIAAKGGIAMHPGIETTLLDMVTETGESFDLMVDNRFPRVDRVVMRPVHACFGELEIAGGGVLTLSEADVWKTKVFYDIKAAERQGCFGLDPEIWGEASHELLIEMVTAALCDKGGGVGRLAQ